MSLQNATIDTEDGVVTIDLTGTDLPFDMILLSGETRDDVTHLAMVVHQTGHADGTKAIAQVTEISGVMQVRGDVIQPERRLRAV